MNRLMLAVCLALLPGLMQAQEEQKLQAPWTLLDQFDQPYTLDQQLNILLVARSMAAAKILEQALADKPKGYLEARNAIFLADVSRMPPVISTLFALPAMREYSYRVLLDYQPRVVTRYPGSDDKVLWIELDRGSIKAQREFSDPRELAQALEQVAM